MNCNERLRKICNTRGTVLCYAVAEELRHKMAVVGHTGFHTRASVDDGRVTRDCLLACFCLLLRLGMGRDVEQEHGKGISPT